MGSIIPVYYQIKQTIRDWIINKEFNSGNKIPSENELADKFNVSRLTVCQAISQLAQEGFLISRRGGGTFVNNNKNLINRFSLEFSGGMDDLFRQVSKVKTRSVNISKMIAPKLVNEKLELNNKNEEVVQIKRIQLFNNKIFSYTVNYLPLKIGLKIDEKSYIKNRYSTLQNFNHRKCLNLIFIHPPGLKISTGNLRFLNLASI